MSVILILIIASLALASLFLTAFIWSVRSGQFEDTTTPSLRVLMDDPKGITVAPESPSSSPASLNLATTDPITNPFNKNLWQRALKMRAARNARQIH